MPKRCICEICTCGRHRCPHRPRGILTRGDQPCMLTEYANRYLANPVQPRQSFKPQERPMQGAGPLAKDTTNRVDYIAHKLQRPFVHQPEEYTKPQGDIDTMTSYKKEYTGKQGDRPSLIRREPRRTVQGKFDGEPTYKTDYRKWSLPQRPDKYNTEPMWIPPTEKFQGASTTKQDYQYKPQGVRQSCKPDEYANLSGDPFNDATNYKIDYVKHPLAGRQRREPEVYQRPGVPFDGLSTFTRDFGPKQGGKQTSCKPNDLGYTSDAPFQGATTNRTDFKTWPVGRPYHHEPDQWQKPSGEMDLRTTHNLEYTKKPIDRAVAKRPQEQRPRSATFDGTTNYSQDYRKWETGRQPRPMGHSEYVPPSQPFEGESTVKSHFVPHKITPVQSYKPDQYALNSDTPFDGNTMYRTEYTPKKADICPAAILDTTRSKYIYQNQDEIGHKFYRPVFESVTEIPTKTNDAAAIGKMAQAVLA